MANEKTTYPCNICGNRFTHKSNLGAHIKTIHQRNQFDNKIKYQCNICGNDYKQKKYLKTHIQAVHQKISFDCKVCGYKATRKGNLIIHIRSLHEGVKYPCVTCNFKAASKASLRNRLYCVSSELLNNHSGNNPNRKNQKYGSVRILLTCIVV